MNCPSCTTELQRKQIKDVQVDQCPTCQGIWFERDELRQAKDAADSDLNWLDFEIWKHPDQFRAEPKNRPCPQCDRALVAVDYGATKVTLDYCPECRGTWLDQGEFKKIVDKIL